jgi:hypothetical protein
VQALAIVCQLLFIVTVTVVGARMLMLARRTHGRHELLMGAGMILVGAVGTPINVASGFGRTVGEMSLPLWIAANFATQIGIGLIYAFTWQVFRPSETWGKAVVLGGIVFMVAGLVTASSALAGAAPEASSPLVARNGLFVGMIGYSGCFLWSAVEGLVQHAHARRRMALGLADAVVTNRFLLWGVFGLTATGINLASITANALGVDPTRSPIVLIPLGVLGLAASVAMYLAFLPPAGYLQLVRARTAARA